MLISSAPENRLHVDRMFIAKGNVLINETGNTCLSDFGKSRIVSEFKGAEWTTTHPSGTPLWAAPEVRTRGFKAEDVAPSCDIYSLGGVVLEVCASAI